MPLRRRRHASRAGRAWAVLLCIVVGATIAGAANAESSSIQASVQVLAIEVDLALSATQVAVGDRLRAEATVTNRGTERLSNLTLELRVDSAGISVRGSTSVTIARLQAGRTSSAAWTLCALQPGNYLLLARATVAGVSVDSGARLLTVSGQRRKACT